jgi:Family of unknown function (DUF5678)
LKAGALSWLDATYRGVKLRPMSSTTEYQAALLPEGVEQYAGKWIAIRGNDIVASADSLEQLYANEQVSRDDTVWVAPEPGTHFL